MKFLLSFIFLWVSLGLSGQNAVVDSLRLELSKAQEDTSFIKHAIDLAYQLRGIHPDSAFLLCQQAAELIPQIESNETQIRALRKVGIGYYHIRKLDTAMRYFAQAKQKADDSGDQKMSAYLLTNMGNTAKAQNNPEKALDLYEQSLLASQTLNDQGAQTVAHNNIGTIHMEQGDWGAAEYHYTEALKIQETLGNKTFQAGLLQNIALISRRQAKFTEAIEHYNRAMILQKELGKLPPQALIWRDIGITHRDQGNFTKALQAYQEALKIGQTLGDKTIASSCLKSIAVIYNDMEDYEFGIRYYQQALAIAEELGDRPLVANLLNGLGRSYMLNQDYELASSYLYRAISIRQEVGPRRSLAYPLYNLGSTYVKQGQLDSAFYYLDRSLPLTRQYKQIHLQTLCLTDLGLAHKQKGNLSAAIAHLEEAYSISPPTAYRQEKIDVTRALYQLYKLQNQPTKALTYHELLKSIQDTLFNEKNAREIARLEAAFEFEEEKQAMAFEQERNNTRQQSFRRAAYVALGVALLIILAVVWYYRQKQEANKQLKRLNVEILQQKEKLEELDHLKSRFFTNIAHELRTPLTVIGGMVEQIKNQPKKWLSKGLPLIERNNTNLLNLVNQIMDLRKLEAGNLQLHMIQGDIIGFLRYILESFQSMADSKDVQLHFLPEQPSLLMDYDQEKLLRIVSNLMSNAIKFTPEGGDVYLTIKKGNTLANAPQLLAKGLVHAADVPLLTIEIRDTGIGIAEEHLPHIFNRFYQVDDSTTRKGEGTGIGLALSKELVQLMKGTIQVDSKLGKGTTITFQLPIQKQVTTLVNADLPPSLSPHTSIEEEKTIEQVVQDRDASLPNLLIIEDNADVVQYLQSILQDNYNISLAENGQIGIDKSLAEVPDLIICDVMMPQKDGFEVCQSLKMDIRTSHIPIILLTARADEASRMAGLRRGADAYLAKPFKQEELLIRLQKLHELRQQLQSRYSGLAPVTPADDPGIQLEDRFITEIRTIIEKHIQEEAFGIPELCEAIGLSRTQLHRKIKALTQRSTSHFIRTTRLQQAKLLLKEGKFSIREVAHKVGMQDPAYFSRIFSEEYGLSPSDFAAS